MICGNTSLAPSSIKPGMFRTNSFTTRSHHNNSGLDDYASLNKRMGVAHSQPSDPSKTVANAVDVVKGERRKGQGDARSVANRCRRSLSDTVEMREDTEDATGLARNYNSCFTKLLERSYSPTQGCRNWHNRAVLGVKNWWCWAWLQDRMHLWSMRVVGRSRVISRGISKGLTPRTICAADAPGPKSP